MPFHVISKVDRSQFLSNGRNELLAQHLFLKGNESTETLVDTYNVINTISKILAAALNGAGNNTDSVVQKGLEPRGLFS